MESGNKPLIYICSTGKCKEEKLAYKIAKYLHGEGLATIGDLNTLMQQLDNRPQRRLIFINDCKGGCIRTYTFSLTPSQYVYLDVSSHATATSLNLEEYMTQDSVSSLQNQLPKL